jgi:hypothetical protein
MPSPVAIERPRSLQVVSFRTTRPRRLLDAVSDLPPLCMPEALLTALGGSKDFIDGVGQRPGASIGEAVRRPYK